MNKKALSGPNGIRHPPPDDRIGFNIYNNAMNVNQGTKTQSKLPPGWCRVKLGDVCLIKNGFAFDSSQFNKERGTPLIRIRDLKTNKPSVFYYGPYQEEFLVENGALLIGMDGEFRCYRWSGPRSLLNQRVCQLLPNDELVSDDFIFYSLGEYLFEIEKTTAFTTVKHISSSQILDINLSLPSLHEQKRIAAILNEQMAAVEKARAAAESQLEAAKDLPAAYLRQVFPKEGQPLPPGWRWVKLGEICIGTGQYGLSEKASSVPQGVPILRMSNIRDGMIFWDDLKYVQLPGDLVHQYRLSKDDLLFNRTNSAELVGKSAVFDGNQDAVFASYLIRYRMRTNIVNPHFLCRYINSQNGRAFIEKNMTRAIGQVNINASTVGTMPIPLPNPDEQARITAILNEQMASAEVLRNNIEQQVHEINALPAALLRRAFRGEL